MSVEPVTPLLVHQVAATSLGLTDPDGSLTLYPVLGVWADLEPLRAAGFTPGPVADQSLPVLMIADSVLDARNPALTTLVLTLADTSDAPNPHPGPHPGASTVAGPSPATLDPHWSLRVPTTWVGLTLAVLGTPLQVRMVLLDGAPPPVPEQQVVPFADAQVVLLPTIEGASHTLTQVMGSEWTRPLLASPLHLEAPEPEVIRDQIWAITSGIALGQRRALNRAVEFAEWVATLQHGEPAEQAKFEAMLTAGSRLLDHTHPVAMPAATDGTIAWPAPMTPLTQHLAQAVDPAALAAVDSGAEFPAIVDAFDPQPALVALMCAAAAKACLATDAPGPHGQAAPPPTPTAAYLLAEWLDEDGDRPWWATRATHPLLMHHDTDVLVHLLTCHPDADTSERTHSPLADRFLHVLTEALDALDLDPDTFADQARALEVVTPHMGDVLYLCTWLLTSLTDAAAHGHACPGCVAVDALVDQTIDQGRLIRAAAAALPVLADLEAAQAGLSVGDADWRSHRAHFLMHWTTHTAVLPDPDTLDD